MRLHRWLTAITISILGASSLAGAQTSPAEWRRALYEGNLGLRLQQDPKLYFYLDQAARDPAGAQRALKSLAGRAPTWRDVARLLREAPGAYRLDAARRLNGGGMSPLREEMLGLIDEGLGNAGMAAEEDVTRSARQLLSRHWWAAPAGQRPVAALLHQTTGTLLDSTNSAAAQQVIKLVNRTGALPPLRGTLQALAAPLVRDSGAGSVLAGLSKVDWTRAENNVGLLATALGSDVEAYYVRAQVAVSTLGNRVQQVEQLLSSGQMANGLVVGAAVMGQVLSASGLVSGRDAERLNKAVQAVQYGVAAYQVLAGAAAVGALGPVGLVALAATSSGLLGSLGGTQGESEEERAFRQEVIGKLDALIDLSAQTLAVSQETRQAVAALRQDFNEYSKRLDVRLDVMQASLGRVEDGIAEVKQLLTQRFNDALLGEVRVAYTTNGDLLRTPAVWAQIGRRAGPFVPFIANVRRLRYYGEVESRGALLARLPFAPPLPGALPPDVNDQVGLVDDALTWMSTKVSLPALTQGQGALAAELKRASTQGAREPVVHPAYWLDATIKVTDLLTALPPPSQPDATTDALDELCRAGCAALRAAETARAMVPFAQLEYVVTARRVWNRFAQRARTFAEASTALRAAEQQGQYADHLTRLLQLVQTPAARWLPSSELELHALGLQLGWIEPAGFKPVTEKGGSYWNTECRGGSWTVRERCEWYFHGTAYVKPLYRFTDRARQLVPTLGAEPYSIGMSRRMFKNKDLLLADGEAPALNDLLPGKLIADYQNNPSAWEGGYWQVNEDKPARTRAAETVRALMDRSRLGTAEELTAAMREWSLDADLLADLADLDRAAVAVRLLSTFGFGECLASRGQLQAFLTGGFSVKDVFMPGLRRYEGILPPVQAGAPLRQALERADREALTRAISALDARTAERSLLTGEVYPPYKDPLATRASIGGCSVGPSALVTGLHTLQATHRQSPHLLKTMANDCIQRLTPRPKDEVQIILHNATAKPLAVSVSYLPYDQQDVKPGRWQTKTFRLTPGLLTPINAITRNRTFYARAVDDQGRVVTARTAAAEVVQMTVASKSVEYARFIPEQLQSMVVKF